jgi:hypothetical protein
MRIFHAVEEHYQLGASHVVQIGVWARRSERHHALMRRAAGDPVERCARLEANRYAGAAGKVDDLLQARSAGALRHHHALQQPAGSQRFANRMNTA